MFEDRDNSIEEAYDSIAHLFDEDKNIKMSESYKKQLDKYFEEISLKSTEALNIKIEHIDQVHAIFKNILLSEDISFQVQEHFWVMGLDERMFISCIYITALGDIDYEAFRKRAGTVFRIAMQKNTTRVILVHSKPNGSLVPTEEEINLVNSFYHFNRLFSVAILDHLVINLDVYYSFFKNGIIKTINKDMTHKIVYEVKDEIEKEKYSLAIAYEDHGLKIGLKRGAKKKSKEIARSMLLIGLDISLIMQCTGLSEKAIRKLK